MSESRILIGCVVGVSACAATALLYVAFSHKHTRTTLVTEAVGLANLGATCYANSLLQGLASSHHFVNALQRHTLYRHEHSHTQLQCSFLDELNRLMLHLHSTNHRASPVRESAARLMDCLRAHGWHIHAGVQHDLTELYNVFVTVWQDETRSLQHNTGLAAHWLTEDEASGNTENVALEGPTCISTKQLLANRAQCLQLHMTTQALQHSACHGLLGTALHCRACSYKKLRVDSMCMLSVPIPACSHNQSVSIEHCLRKYMAIEMLRDYECDRCCLHGERVHLVKRHGFIKVPQTLLIQLQRVQYDSGYEQKCDTHVIFKQTIDTLPFIMLKTQSNNHHSTNNPLTNQRLPMTNQEQAQNDTLTNQQSDGNRLTNRCVTVDTASNSNRLRLCAVLVHYGQVHSGHYECYKRVAKHWYRISDCTVQKVHWTLVQTLQAYALVYDRID